MSCVPAVQESVEERKSEVKEDPKQDIPDADLENEVFEEEADDPEVAKVTGPSSPKTPESPRKNKKMFLSRRNADGEESGAIRKRSVSSSSANTANRRSSETTTTTAQRMSLPSSGAEDSESSRKSSISSGRKRSLFHNARPSGQQQGGDPNRQFAVTFFVNEHDKTKLVDILHKAKSVISKKVEKVMGKKQGTPSQQPSSTSSTASKPNPASRGKSVSSADALTSILESWVSQEEEKGKAEERELEDLIERQQDQIRQMQVKGVEPLPVAYLPVIPTVVSPVPEEDEEAEEDDEAAEGERKEGGPSSKEHNDLDIAVQEVIEGQDNFLRPPPAASSSSRFALSRSGTPGSSASFTPRRSLSPCEHVPRHFNMPESELYPPSLRRPSSHYDESAQAASSRPVSPRVSSPPPITTTAGGGLAVTAVDGNGSRRNSLLAVETSSRRVSVNEGGSRRNSAIMEQQGLYDQSANGNNVNLGPIQRPESMTVPIGGVWRPDDSDVEVSLFPEDDEGADADDAKQQGQGAVQDCEHPQPLTNPQLTKITVFVR